MKILYIISNLNIGGAQNFILELSKNISKKNAIVSILVFESISYENKKMLCEYNIKYIELKIKNKYSIFNFRKFLINIKDFDIIHVNLYPNLYYIGLLKRLNFINKKIIYTEHSTYNNRRKYNFLKIIERSIYSQYDHIVSISDGVKLELENWLGKMKNSLVIENGVDLNKYKKKSDLPNNDNIKVVMVARFSDEKDHLTAIKAIERLPKNYFLHFYGDGKNLLKIKNYVEKNNIKDRVIFHGISKTLYKELCEYDIFLLSSFWEGFGLSVIEAKAAGLPVILSKVRGMYDIFKNNALFFPVGDYKNLSKLIKLLASKNDLYLNIINKDKNFLKNYDINNTIEKYYKLYLGDL